MKVFRHAFPLALGLLSAQAAQATLLPLQYNIKSGEYVRSFTEQGFKVDLQAFNGAGIYVFGKLALAPRTPVDGGKVVVSQLNGQPFSFSSIDAMRWQPLAASLTLKGYRNGQLVGTDTFLADNAWFAGFSAASLKGQAIDRLEITGDRHTLADGQQVNVGFRNLVLGQAPAAPVPEPESWALLGLGLTGVLLARRRK